MAARCDAARLVYPGSIAAPLILGTIGGSGGKFLSDAILAGAGLAQGMHIHSSSCSCPVSSCVEAPASRS